MNAGGGASALRDHVRYISRAGAGKDKETAILFDAQEEGLGRKDFVTLCENDRHHFRLIISPENGREIKDFQLYVRDVMALIEKDLNTGLQWIAAVHHDTDDPHAHVILRGITDRGTDLVIGQDYIKEGIRKRAQEVATTLLGERSLEEIQKGQEKEVEALRVTSLDRFIEKQADAARTVDVRKRQSFGQSLFYESLVKGRLKFLAKAGLASENPPGIFQIKEDYQDALHEIATKNDIVKRLYNRVETGLDGLTLYSMKAGQGPTIAGRVVAKGFYDEITDRKFVVVREIAGGLHYVPMGGYKRYDELEEGSLVRVRPGEPATGKADYNINNLARRHGGIYDATQHLAHIEREMKYIAENDRSNYIEAHIVRLGTLEKNGVVEELGEGRYRVSVDILERGAQITKEINIREKKRFYPILDILSPSPPEKLIEAAKKTWLDKEIYKQSIGKSSSLTYDEAISAAIEQRKNWLIKHDLALIQSNGSFAMRSRALSQLDKLEVYSTGRQLAQRLGVEFKDKQVSINSVMRFEGDITLETGIWAAVTTELSLFLAPLQTKPSIAVGEKVVFHKNNDKTLEIQPAGVARGKIHMKDKDQERDL